MIESIILSIYFLADQPADSGVGASVGSCSNMAVGGSSKSDLVYQRRRFTEAFHDFVADCSVLDATRRPNVSQMLGHTFLKQQLKNKEP
jgi:hypothetical protein